MRNEFALAACGAVTLYQTPTPLPPPPPQKFSGKNTENKGRDHNVIIFAPTYST